MRISKQFMIAGLVALCVVVIAPMVQAQRNNIIVVPARARMVRLGFDIQALRGGALISYRKTDDPLQPLVHVWNRARSEWQDVNLAQMTNTPNIPAIPQNVFVIGPASIVPEVLLASLSHAYEIETIQTFSVAEILTRLDKTMAFSVEEWRALAKRYDLEITELHDERSRWGRFGPPRRYREQMDEKIPERIIEVPEIEPVRPRAVEPVREKQRILIPEPSTLEPAPEEPEVETPAPVVDPAEEEIIDDAIEPVTRSVQEEKGYTRPARPTVEEVEDFPIK